MELLGQFANQAAIALDLLQRARRARATLDGDGELAALARLAAALEGNEAGLRLVVALEDVLKRSD
jgi:GAF domain-containing protein